MFKPSLIFVLFSLIIGCRSQTIEDYRKDLQSDDVDKICNACYYIGEAKDKESVVSLLKDIYDERTSHHARYKGMSVYYCKAGALKKITGLNINIQQHQPPDSVIISKFINWAIEQKLIDSVERIKLSNL
ncbi:hypothetical protein GXP67_33715 [Rhodocytophaga rosea]|uniref:Lipoprotein n=1 Tax=Rhodocytophaga rosea TaxID=2704465 RepID=A0A6C0GVA0_9BACT|nr:hypothetical protein [Rhodocytophaga rosea]QHT71262.1 hypothetical protein GXP67_33715 [Rhodocytophaga rosea]